MKWIGQHIYDLVSRFRDDVYLEDISTGTIASGAHLGLDSNNKIVKAVDAGGDLTSITVGDGLTGLNLTGPIPNLFVDTAIPQLASIGHAGITTNFVAGDVTIYNAVNNGNPYFAIGSTSTESFRITSHYNSGAQTLDHVEFKTFTSSSTADDGRYRFYVDDVIKFELLDDTIRTRDADITIHDTTASSATEGGKLIFQTDDGAAMGDDHRLGVIEFKGAEDASETRTIGARIEAMCDAAWSASENGARLDFYTTDANASESKVLTLDSDKLATFAAGITVAGALKAGNSGIVITDTTNSSATQGGSLKLIADDDNVLADNHRLGVIEFQSREVGHGTAGYSATGNIQTGARIQAIADATWSATENGTSLEFYTTDGNASESVVLTLDSNKLATFTGGITAAGTITGNVTGDLTGEADTVATIAGLAPNTATTQAEQGNITTCDSLIAVGTIGTGEWRATAIASAYLDADTAHLSGTQSFTGTKTFDETISGAIDGNAATATTLATTRAINGVNFNGSAAITIPTPRVWGAYIKLLPTDFMPNDDGGTSKGITLNDSGTTGMKPGVAAMELVAIVDIPLGFTATHVDIYDNSHDLAINVFEMNIGASGMAARGSGNANTTLDMTDVESTVTNFLAIRVETTGTSERVFGGRITIAPN